MMDCDRSLKSDSNDVLTYKTLEHLTQCFMEEADEMHQEYERKRIFLLERQRIITDNEEKASVLRNGAIIFTPSQNLFMLSFGMLLSM